MYNSITQSNGAHTEVEKLVLIEGELTQKLREFRQGTTASEEKAADALLAGGSADGVFDEINRQQFHIMATERAIVGARRKRIAAVQASWQREATELRQQAEGKRAEARTILEKCETSLRALSKLQGVEYNSAILYAQRSAGWLPDLIEGRPLERCSPAQARPDIGARYLVPHSEQLITEAAALEQRAAELEIREVQQDGSLTKSSPAELLAELQAMEPTSLVPAIYRVEAWVAECEARLKRERPELAAHRLQYRLVWRAGEIDRTASSLTALGSGVSAGDYSFQAA